MKLITLEQLLDNWHIFTYEIERDAIDSLDWDDLMGFLGTYCPEAENRNIVVTDIDMKTYHRPAISFSLIE